MTILYHVQSDLMTTIMKTWQCTQIEYMVHEDNFYNIYDALIKNESNLTQVPSST